MKKFLIFLLCCAFCMPVQAAQNWDYEDADTTIQNGLICDTAGNPITGKVKADYYSHYMITEVANGKLVKEGGELYSVNGNFIGSIYRKPNGAIESDNIGKGLLDEIGRGILTGNNLVAGTKRYVSSCAKDYAQLNAPDGGDKKAVLLCSDIVKSYRQEGIGKPEEYTASQKKVDNDVKIVVNGPFIPLKYRSAISKGDPSIGMSVQIQKSGNAVFSFNVDKIK